MISFHTLQHKINRAVHRLEDLRFWLKTCRNWPWVGQKSSRRHLWGSLGLKGSFSARFARREKVEPPSSDAPAQSEVVFLHNLDKKLTDAAFQLLGGGVFGFSDEIGEAGIVAVREFVADDIRMFYKTYKITRFIVLDTHDSPYGQDELFLSQSVARLVRAGLIKIAYLKLQYKQKSYYDSLAGTLGRGHICLLSLPLLLGGSRHHISTEWDASGEALFSKRLRASAPAWTEQADSDYSFIGAITSQDRARLLEKLEHYSANSRWRSHIKIAPAGVGGIGVSQASTPFPLYIERLRRTRINFSLNGNACFCLKDGECFSNGAFVFRQDHPCLHDNPLTPVDGVHWVVFNQDNVIQKLDYYLQNENERQRIQKQGYENFKAMISGGFGRTYSHAISQFYRTGRLPEDALGLELRA